MQKWWTKLQAMNITANQIKGCNLNLTTKYLPNDYLDYKCRAVHGKTQFNVNLSKFVPGVNRWCRHCTSKGINTAEDFAHMVYYSPQVQILLHDIHAQLKLGNKFQLHHHAGTYGG